MHKNSQQQLLIIVVSRVTNDLHVSRSLYTSTRATPGGNHGMASMNEIVARLHEIETALVEGAEWSDDLKATFDLSIGDLKQKTDTYGFAIERLESLQAFWKERADANARVAKACTATIDRLKENVRFAMGALAVQEISGNETRFKLTSTGRPKLELDTSKLHENYMMQITETVPDRERIKQDLELGETIPGAALIEVQALRKYAVSPNAKQKEVANDNS